MKLIQTMMLMTLPGILAACGSVTPEDHTGQAQNALVKTPSTTGTATMFDVPASIATIASSINEKGRVGGRFTSSNGRVHGFILGTDGQFTTLDRSATNRLTSLYGYNNNRIGAGGWGQINGAGCNAPGTGECTAFLVYSDGTFKDIVFDDAIETMAFTASDRGDVVGQYTTRNPDGTTRVHGYLLRGCARADDDRDDDEDEGDRDRVPADRCAKSNRITLDPPDATLTYTKAINNRRQVVGHVFIARGGKILERAYVHDANDAASPYVIYNVPNAKSSVFNGITSNGTIVGQFIDAAGLQHGFAVRYRKGQFSNAAQVDVPGAAKAIVRGRNDDGQMVGQAVTPDNHSHGFLFNPPNDDRDDDQDHNGDRHDDGDDHDDSHDHEGS